MFTMCAGACRNHDKQHRHAGAGLCPLETDRDAGNRLAFFPSTFLQLHSSSAAGLRPRSPVLAVPKIYRRNPMKAFYGEPLRAAFLVIFLFAICRGSFAQANSTSVTGTVLDPTGAVVPNATVEIHNPVSQF